MPASAVSTSASGQHIGQGSTSASGQHIGQGERPPFTDPPRPHYHNPDAPKFFRVPKIQKSAPSRGRFGVFSRPDAGRAKAGETPLSVSGAHNGMMRV